MTTAPDTIVIDTPELLMPSDRPAFVSAPAIMAVGAYQKVYESTQGKIAFDALLEDRTRIEETLDAAMTADQEAIRPTAYIARIWTPSVGAPVHIYAKVYSGRAARIYEQALHTPSMDEIEAGQHQLRVEDALRRNWLWGRFFSTVVPNGEWGCVHRSMVDAVITETHFDDMRLRGWES
jgi:hypothetical protein